MGGGAGTPTTFGAKWHASACVLVAAVACRATNKVLEVHSRQFGLRFDLIDQLYMALGWGYGHGAAHVIFFVLSFLPITTGDGTWCASWAQCGQLRVSSRPTACEALTVLPRCVCLLCLP